MRKGFDFMRLIHYNVSNFCISWDISNLKDKWLGEYGL